MKTAAVYLRRYLGQYVLTAVAFAVITFGFCRLLTDSLEQSASINFFKNLPYDLIVPKGTSIDSLLFLQDLQKNELEYFIPSNLYNTLRENPELRLIPLLKENSDTDSVTLATDISEFDLNSRLAFLKKGGLTLKAIPLADSRRSDPLWGKAVLNLILVEGPYAAREQLRTLVQKKTVAEYVAVGEKTAQIMQLLGWTEKKIAVSWVLFLGVFAAVLASIVLSVRPLWIEISTVLKRYGLSTGAILVPVLAPLLVLYLVFLLLISQII